MNWTGIRRMLRGKLGAEPKNGAKHDTWDVNHCLFCLLMSFLLMATVIRDLAIRG